MREPAEYNLKPGSHPKKKQIAHQKKRFPAEIV
jgi:hypothetical protein